ncbi:5-methyltetrahydropteroyltriglutamate--homocysteine S-methyltransferase [Geobacillus sp. FSL W8-0032]|uniref:5-methyltetrahydropteroyltriglutamate--homocysteine methyltransferase n=1 Tax=Geobacillus icigianus TaxID=1430331 RepID=A0ABU6BLJ3_9BACL|nr:5-methyltetrahydropteroyltriglutamate--homocysteine S-methyltransferase [Geobacillus icigianus]MEB3752610.1 5-methyltetrahydropteroyltriglutamate--homocysteine methyltransferase [Geobacillus icigianus]
MEVLRLAIHSSNLGYPRIGEQREWKKALESFWNGQLEEANLMETMKTIQLSSIKKQMAKGIELIPIGDFSLYDHVLDTAFMFGYIPKRFGQESERRWDTYFAMARGTSSQPAMAMTKWFNTNYHYIVPELDGLQPRLMENFLLRDYQFIKDNLSIETKPVLLGPVTFLILAKLSTGVHWHKHLQLLVPVYIELLDELYRAGVRWVQVDEPILVQEIDEDIVAAVEYVYHSFHQKVPGVQLILQTYFESLSNYPEIVSLPVAGFGLDFVHDDGENLYNMKKYGFPKGKWLAAGMIDGRNVWKSTLVQKAALLEELSKHTEHLIIQPSSSLLYVPITVKHEHRLPKGLVDSLAFADEKLDEVRLLAEYAQGKRSLSDLCHYDEQTGEALRLLRGQSIKKTMHPIEQTERPPYAKRRQAQQQHLKLPLLPTTTIGSFPQTREVRQARLKRKKQEWDEKQYQTFIRKQIAKWIEIQEKLELDVLVHGEFERTDMVEFFGEKLGGIACTTNGWVQSYGSRCVRPPIIFGDVVHLCPITVEESVYAQSLTEKPVKGMLTGPVTLYNWSFVRRDLPRSAVLNQLALAVRQEVLALEQAGIRIIQVDEPALREGLPLKRQKQPAYWQEAVYAFRLATSAVRLETQIHTHMCYSDFSEMIDIIDDLDPDVISIEAARSGGELLSLFEIHTYRKQIGLGVYDIHSPRIPSRDEILIQLERALRVLRPDQFWVNPDCGLKTRTEKEAIASLQAMVAAAKEMRNRLFVSLQGGDQDDSKR